MASLSLDDSARLFDLDGHVDSKGIRYIGKAAMQPDGMWKCLADLNGCLCLVLVRIFFQGEDPQQETDPKVELQGW